MGLSISSSIVEHHGGRLWTAANDGPSVTFQFSLLPTRKGHSDVRFLRARKQSFFQTFRLEPPALFSELVFRNYRAKCIDCCHKFCHEVLQHRSGEFDFCPLRATRVLFCAEEAFVDHTRP
jgi:hypothetical protein